MADKNKKSQSTLVNSVMALDAHLADLVRLGEKIEGLKMETDFDYERAKKLMELFSQSGEGVASEIMRLSVSLTEARRQAEAVAAKVSERAELLRSREVDEQAKMLELQQLAESVRTITQSLNVVRPNGDNVVTAEDRALIEMKLSEVDLQITGLIEKATAIHKEAQTSRMRAVEQGADSLRQSLQAIHLKLVGFQIPPSAEH